MKKSTIDVKCGIYDTEYTIRDYGSKIVVTSPYIKWVNNNGGLSFAKTTLTNHQSLALVRKMVENDETIAEVNTVGGFLTLDEVCDGRVADLV